MSKLESYSYLSLGIGVIFLVGGISFGFGSEWLINLPYWLFLPMVLIWFFNSIFYPILEIRKGEK